MQFQRNHHHFLLSTSADASSIERIDRRIQDGDGNPRIACGGVRFGAISVSWRAVKRQGFAMRRKWLSVFVIKRHSPVSPEVGNRQSRRSRARGRLLVARIDVHQNLILSLVNKTSGITLKELQAPLTELGFRFSIGPLRRFFNRHAITWKQKDRPRHRALPAGHQIASADLVQRQAGSQSRRANLRRRDLGAGRRLRQRKAD